MFYSADCANQRARRKGATTRLAAVSCQLTYTVMNCNSTTHRSYNSFESV